MTIRNSFTKIPEEWFSSFFPYIDKRDAQSIALADKSSLEYFSNTLSQRMQDAFDTLYVLKTPSNNAKYQICTVENTIPLKECYEMLQKHRLHHLAMVLSTDREDTFSSVKKCPQEVSPLPMLSLKVSFIFRHSRNIRPFMQAMKESGCFFETVTFLPMTNDKDFNNDLEITRNNYISVKKHLESFSAVTNKAIYAFHTYNIVSNNAPFFEFDCAKIKELDPSQLSETFASDIPNLAIDLHELDNVPILQNIILEKTSVENLQIILPNKAGGYAGENIEEQYQNLFDLIQTKFTDITELCISLGSYDCIVVVALCEKIIHPILNSFPDTKVFLFYDKQDIDFEISHKNFQGIPRRQASYSKLAQNENFEIIPDYPPTSLATKKEDSFKVLISNDGKMQLLPGESGSGRVRKVKKIFIKYDERKFADTNNRAMSRLYLKLAGMMKEFAMLHTIFIKPRLFKDLSPASIQREFNDLSFYINQVASHVFYSNKEGKMVLNPDNLYLDFPNKTQLIGDELNRLRTIYEPSVLEINEPTLVRIDATKMNDEEFCLNLITKGSVNKLVFDVITKADFELFNTQFALFTGSPMDASVKTVYFNLSENLKELDEDSVTMYYSEIVQLLNHFSSLKKIHFRLACFKDDKNWYRGFLQEVMKKVVAEKPQVELFLHSDDGKTQLIATNPDDLKVAHTASSEIKDLAISTKIVNSTKMKDDKFCVELMTSHSINEIVFEISTLEDSQCFEQQFKELFNEAPIRASVKTVHINLSENTKELLLSKLMDHYINVVSLIYQFVNVKEVHFRVAHLGIDPNQHHDFLLKVIKEILEQPQITLFLYQDKVADCMSFTDIQHKNFVLK